MVRARCKQWAGLSTLARCHRTTVLRVDKLYHMRPTVRRCSFVLTPTRRCRFLIRNHRTERREEAHITLTEEDKTKNNQGDQIETRGDMKTQIDKGTLPFRAVPSTLKSTCCSCPSVATLRLAWMPLHRACTAGNRSTALRVSTTFRHVPNTRAVNTCSSTVFSVTAALCILSATRSLSLSLSPSSALAAVLPASAARTDAAAGVSLASAAASVTTCSGRNDRRGEIWYVSCAVKLYPSS